MRGLVKAALLTERTLRPDCAVLGEQDPAVGKALLAREASTPFPGTPLALLDCDSDERWALYEDRRVPVEREFGLDEAAARQLVRRTRDRGIRIGLQLWLAATGPGHVVGAIGAFLPGQDSLAAARLQEVDIFPPHRGQGFGLALLESVRLRLSSQGVHLLIIGADEDDWPLTWYRRLGFRDVARVDAPVVALSGLPEPM